MKKRVFLVDVGTHQAQEYRALFGYSSLGYARRYFRRRLGALLGRGTAPSIRWLAAVTSTGRRLRAARPDFFCVFVEPNGHVFRLPVYAESDLSVNIALSASTNAVSLVKLFFANEDEKGQGSSLFVEKDNVSPSHYCHVVNIDGEHFAHQLKAVFDRIGCEDYALVLRINNEGAEADVIYAFRRVFTDHLKLVLGSLQDTAITQGGAGVERLHAFLRQKHIPFVPFSSELPSWPQAMVTVLKLWQQQAEGVSTKHC